MMIKEGYKGREQAQHKHDLLNSYLWQLFQIIGLAKYDVINYVDCFSGPWKESDDDLKDTSIALSVEKMQQCVRWMKIKRGKDIQFRGLYIEKDKSAFSKLESYTRSHTTDQIQLHALNGDFTQVSSPILEWCKTHFTFFFIDPMGWTQVSPDILEPLLKRPDSEFLINYMFAFQNRMFEVETFQEDQNRFLCGRSDEVDTSSPESRERDMVKIYTEIVKNIYLGYNCYIPIERPGQTRTLYYLLYLTRHPIGIKIFADIAEKQSDEQARTHHQTQARKQVERTTKKTGMTDIFGDSVLTTPTLDYERKRECDAEKAYGILKDMLTSQGSIKFDHETWANLLESSRLLPGDFHKAMRQLHSKGQVCCDKPFKRRPKHFIHVDWTSKAETWSYIEQPNADLF